MNDLSHRIAALSPEKLKLLTQRLNHKEEDVLSRSQIKPQSRDSNFFPLSFAQQRLWFIDQLQPGNIALNISQSIRLTGKLNVKALQETFNEVIRRHEIFRTTFTSMDGQPIQVIAPPQTFKLAVIDLRSHPPNQREFEVIRLANVEAQQPFNLGTGPLIRVTLVHLTEQEYALFLTMHHIVCDGWSIGVLIREIAALYEAFSHGKPLPLAELTIQYADFAVWQRQWLQGEELETQLNYWKQQLSDRLPVLELPTDFQRPAVQTFNGARQHLILPKALSEQLKAWNQREGITLFMVLLTAFQTLLYWYTGQEEIVVGTDIANRNQTETKGLIGFFVNQLVLSTNLSGEPSFEELLSRVREVTLNAYAHQDLPFDKLVDVLNPVRNMARTPLFQVKLVLENTQTPSLELFGLIIKPLQVEKKTTQLDLLLEVTEIEQGIILVFEYNTDLFSATTITRLLGNFETLLNQVLIQPTVKLNELAEIITTADKEQRVNQNQQRKQEYQLKLKKVKRQLINATDITEAE
jgi:Condensation domain